MDINSKGKGVIGIVSSFILHDLRLVQDDTVHKGISKYHKTDEK